MGVFGLKNWRPNFPFSSNGQRWTRNVALSAYFKNTSYTQPGKKKVLGCGPRLATHAPPKLIFKGLPKLGRLACFFFLLIFFNFILQHWVFVDYFFNFIIQYLINFELIFIICFNLLFMYLSQSQTNILIFNWCLILQVSIK